MATTLPLDPLDRLRDSGGKIVLNADDLFKQYPPYEKNFAARKTLGPLLYPVASQFRDEAFRHLLAKPFGQDNTVVFTAGGGASGKSTVLRALAALTHVEFIVDITFSLPQRALNQVDEALAVGRKVEIHYVFRPFEECVLGMLERALDPKVGRVVPIDDMARTHSGSQETVLLAMRKYFGEPQRVEILRWKNIRRNQIKSMFLQSLQKRRHPSVDELCKKRAKCAG
jgi:hypothetical protein